MNPTNTDRGGSRFVSNSAALAVSVVATSVVTLGQVKLLAASLDRADFGLFVALRGLSLLFSMLAANGLPQVLVRFLPVHEAWGRRHSAIRLSAVSLGITTVLCVAFVALVWLLRERFFAYESAEVLTRPFQLWFYATTMGVSLKLVLYAGLTGMRRITLQVILEVSALVIQLGWIFLARHDLTVTTLFQIIGTMSLATVLVGLPLFLFCLRRDVGDHAGAEAAPSAAPSYRGYWGWSAGLSLVALAFTDVDRYLLSGVLTLEMLSLFHIGSRLMRMTNRFLGVPVLAFQPEVSRLDAEGKDGRVRQLTDLFMKFNAVISVFAALCVASFALELIVIVANREYTGALAVLIVLLASMPLTALTAPLTTVMKARDQVRHALYCDLAWALTYVVSLVVLGRMYGLIGVGLAQVIASLVQLGAAVRFSRLLGPSFVSSLLFRVLMCAAVSFGPVLVVPRLWALSGAAGFAIKLVLFVVAVAVFRKLVTVVSVLTREDRDVLRDLLGKRGVGALARHLV